VIPWKLACTALYCSAVQSCGQFRSQDFGLKLNWEAPMGSDLVYSILSQNGTLMIQGSLLDCSRTPVPRNRFVQVESMEAGSMEEAGSGHEDSSHNILTLDALQVLSRSQVTPGLSMSMRMADM
jgi:hypothetical protein